MSYTGLTPFVLLACMATIMLGCATSQDQQSFKPASAYKYPKIQEGIYWHSFASAPNNHEHFLIFHDGQYRFVYRGGPNGQEYMDFWGEYAITRSRDPRAAGHLLLNRINGNTERFYIREQQGSYGIISSSATANNVRFDYRVLDTQLQAELIALPRNMVEDRLDALARQNRIYTQPGPPPTPSN